jgi:hypothetical protein
MPEKCQLPTKSDCFVIQNMTCVVRYITGAGISEQSVGQALRLLTPPIVWIGVQSRAS